MSYRLVVVATEHATLRTLAGQLGESVRVAIFTNANDALWDVRDNPPEVLITENDLPGMSGIDLAEILPNFELPTKVLIWSENVTPALQEQAAAAGVLRVLGPSTDVATLRSALEDAVNNARVAAAEAETRAQAAAEAAAAEAAAAEAAAAEAAAAEERRRAEARMAKARSAPSPRPTPPVPAAPPPAESRNSRNFTPARVTLPPVSERETAPPAPSAPPARGGLAARSKAAVDRKPSPQPPAEHHDIPARRSSGNLIVTADNINPIRSIMSQLTQELGTQCVMLTDRAGMVLVDVGSTDNLPMMIVLPLLSTSFSTASEVSRQLREEDAQTLYIHEGVNYDLYCFDVLQRFLLVLVFNKKVASSKIGSVWVNSKRAIRELRDALDN